MAPIDLGKHRLCCLVTVDADVRHVSINYSRLLLGKWMTSTLPIKEHLLIKYQLTLISMTSKDFFHTHTNLRTPEHPHINIHRHPTKWSKKLEFLRFVICTVKQKWFNVLQNISEKCLIVLCVYVTMPECLELLSTE